MDWGQLGLLGRLHAKLSLNWSMQHLFGVLIVKLRFNKWRKYRGQQFAGPAGWYKTSSGGKILNECSLLFHHKIHCGTMSVDKDKYLTSSQESKIYQVITYLNDSVRRGFVCLFQNLTLTSDNDQISDRQSK